MRSRPRYHKARRPFVLIEVLVALCLVTACLFPLLRPYAHMKRQELVNIEKMQLERFAPDAYTTLKCQIFESKFGDLNSLNSEKVGSLAKSYCLYLPKNRIKDLCCHYKLSKIKKFKKISDKTHYLLLRIDLAFAPYGQPSPIKYPFTYKVLISERHA